MIAKRCSVTVSIAADTSGRFSFIWRVKGAEISTSAGKTSGQVLIDTCYNEGVISGPYAGGICAIQFRNGTITYCWNIGELTGEGSGGICGSRVSHTDNNSNSNIHFYFLDILYIW